MTPTAALRRVQIPLPEVSEQWEGVMVREVAARATVSPQSLPSAAFYTFVNTHQSLNCVAFTSDAACVAGATPQARRGEMGRPRCWC